MQFFKFASKKFANHSVALNVSSGKRGESISKGFDSLANGEFPNKIQIQKIGKVPLPYAVKAN